MKDDIRREDEYRSAFLDYLAAHVFAYVLGFLLGQYLFDKPIFREWLIDLLLLLLLYVVLFFANLFVANGLDYVFNLYRRLNGLLVMFLSYVVLIASFFFLYFWLSGWDFGKEDVNFWHS